MINLYDILDAADGQLFGEPVAQIFNGFCFESRQVKSGDLFVALKTERGDGHHFMEDAIKAGATGLMCKHPPTFDTHGITVIIMHDVEAAMMRWTNYVLTKFGTTVVAVTGSYGKSTTKEAISQVMRIRYQVYTGRVNIPGRFALPLALGQLTQQHEIAILEYESTQAGEMAEMITAAPPMVGVVTNINPAKASKTSISEERILIENLPQDGLAVLNHDDALVREIQCQVPKLTISVDKQGTSFGADLTAYNIIQALDKTGFDLRYGNQRFIAKWVRLLGAHNLYAVLSAISVGLSFEVPLENSLNVLTQLDPLPGRMRPLMGVNRCQLIDDTYDATPNDMLLVLEWLKALRPQPSIKETQMGFVSPRGKIFVVIGDIADPTERRPQSYLEVGASLAEVATEIVSEGDDAANAVRAALDKGFPITSTHITFSAQDAATAIRNRLGPKDLVLVKGNRSARMERVVAALLHRPEDAVLLPRQDNSLDSDWTIRPISPTWVHVDTAAVAHNVKRMKEIIGVQCTLMAVVKTDAYGHGAIPVSTTAGLNGADYLGVTSMDEALQLRRAGITKPILILGYTVPYAARQVVRHDLTLSIYDLNTARAFNQAAAELDRTIKAHVRIDVSRNGMGLMREEVPQFIRGLHKLDRIHLEGIYTHISSNIDRQDAIRQLNEFDETINMLKTINAQFQYVHAAASGPALHIPEARFNMVRCGAALYGLHPGRYTLPPDFKTALTWKTTIVQLKRVSTNLMGLVASDTTRTMAVLPVGYASGFRVGPLAWTYVLVKGKRAPVVGNVESYFCAVDVTDIDDVRVGDEVVLIGEQGEEKITVEDAADFLNTLNYEVISMIMPRASRTK